MTVASWMDTNLETQGYCLAEGERRALRLGLRFSTGLCLVLCAVALAFESATAFAVLSTIGAVAGFSSRHPFDHLWNRGVRHLVGGPAVPPSPTRRRHSFKVATAMLGAIALLLFVGAPAAALVLGVFVLAACTLVTVTNFCVPSTALSLIERRRARQVRPATS